MRKLFSINLIFIFLLTLVYYFMLPTSIYAKYPMGDTPIFEYFGYAIAKGKIPYLDLFDHKGVFIFFSHAIGYYFFGEIGVKILFSICIFIFLLYSYKITKLFSKSNEYILVLAVIFIVYVNLSELGLNVETLVLPAITISLYKYIKFFLYNNISKIDFVILGLLFTFTFFTRANMVGLWFIFTLCFIVYNIYIKNNKIIIEYVLYFLIGVIIITIPLIIYFIKTDSFYDMIYQAFYVNIKYASGSGVGKWKILSWALNIFNTVHILLIVLIVNLIIKNNKLFLYNFIFVLLLFLSLMSKREYIHYLIVLVPLLVPYLAIFFKYIYNYLGDNTFKKLALIFIFYFIYLEQVTYIYDNINSRDKINISFNKVSNYIKDNSSETDLIYTHRLTGAIYLGSERMSSTKYFFIPSIDSDLYIDDFKNIMENKPPKYIVYSDYYSSNSLVDDYVKEFINENYKKVEQIENFDIYLIDNN